MAEIAPFRGLRYNLDKTPDLTRVVTPPYDVISPEEQKRFHQLSPYNMVYLELGKATPEDSPRNNPHTRASRYLEEWVGQGVLAREPAPAIYYCEEEYALAPGVSRTRAGFICVLRLEDFQSGGVKPHERTFQGVKDERLGLMLACDANLSPVFALFADPDGVIDGAVAAEKKSPPVMDFKDTTGMEHRIWAVTDLAAQEKMRNYLLDKPLFIADGHHRYETALKYRSIQRERFPDRGPRAPFEYIMVYLAAMEQPGLTILPTHRLLKHLGAWEPDSFLSKVEEYFVVDAYNAGTADGEGAWKQQLEAAGARKETAVVFCCKGAERFYLLKARRDRVREFLSGLDIPDVLQGLDVVVLDRLLLRHLMGLTEEFLGDSANIHFKHDRTDALNQLRSGTYDAGFLINPTRIEQVQEVAGAGLTMPHKSTYFYPKVFSGLVINHPLTSTEEIIR